MIDTQALVGKLLDKKRQLNKRVINLAYDRNSEHNPERKDVLSKKVKTIYNEIDRIDTKINKLNKHPV